MRFSSSWSYVDLDSEPPFIMVWRSVRAGGDIKTRGLASDGLALAVGPAVSAEVSCP